MVIANAVAVQCIGYDCFKFDIFAIALMPLELIFEIRGFIKIYKRKEKKRR
jgi:hypothetical protein